MEHNQRLLIEDAKKYVLARTDTSVGGVVPFQNTEIDAYCAALRSVGIDEPTLRAIAVIMDNHALWRGC